MILSLRFSRLALALGMATAAAGAAAASPVPIVVPVEGAALSIYAEGRLALAGGDLALGLRGLSDVVSGFGASEMAEQRLFEAAMLAGDREAALGAARRMMAAARATAAAPSKGSPAEGSPAEPAPVVVLAALADALLRGDAASAAAARARLIEPSMSTALLTPLVDAWLLAAAGRVDDALASLPADDSLGIAALYFAEHRAHLTGFAGRHAEAADLYAERLAADGAEVVRLRLAAVAHALEAARSDPQRLAQAYALAAGGGNDPQLLALRAAMEGGRPSLRRLPQPNRVRSAADGLGLGLLRMGQDLARVQPGQASLAFLRMAGFLSPDRPEPAWAAAHQLAVVGHVDTALALLDGLGAQGPRRPRQAREAWARQIAEQRLGLLARAERWDELALLLAARARAPQARAEDWLRLAEVESRRNRHAAQLEPLERALALLPESARAERARALLMQGAALERLDRFPEAEQALRAALALSPEDPVILNYLGYALLDRGLALDEAEALIARAHAAAPDNGAITDSMGWALFQRGRPAEALPLLEQARAQAPQEPVIADHLGDALWAVGRRIEARHAWAAALALEPEAGLAERLRAKLERGPDDRLAGAAP